jgi:hypothetical protein
VVCSPKSMGGLGILDLEKFERALRLWWPWYEWTDLGCAWMGMGKPCNEEDMKLFHQYRHWEREDHGFLALTLARGSHA